MLIKQLQEETGQQLSFALFFWDDRGEGQPLQYLSNASLDISMERVAELFEKLAEEMPE